MCPASSPLLQKNVTNFRQGNYIPHGGGNFQPNRIKSLGGFQCSLDLDMVQVCPCSPKRVNMKNMRTNQESQLTWLESHQTVETEDFGWDGRNCSSSNSYFSLALRRICNPPAGPDICIHTLTIMTIQTFTGSILKATVFPLTKLTLSILDLQPSQFDRLCFQGPPTFPISLIKRFFFFQCPLSIPCLNLQPSICAYDLLEDIELTLPTIVRWIVPCVLRIVNGTSRTSRYIFLNMCCIWFAKFKTFETFRNPVTAFFGRPVQVCVNKIEWIYIYIFCRYILYKMYINEM